jgi:hypothetical protein
MSEKKIYFLCNGTSTYDVIDSLYNHDKSFKKIKKDDTPKLEEIGIKEIKLASENEKVKNIIKKISNNSSEPNIFCSLDPTSIETSIVFLKSISKLPKVSIYPLPYMSSNTNLKLTDLHEYKKQFGDLDKSKDISDPNKYWNIYKVNNNFVNLKNPNILINWAYTQNITNSAPLRVRSTDKFKKLLEQIVVSQYRSNNNYLFVCDSNIIESILKMIKGAYNRKKTIIERSSLWEITVSINFNKLDFKLADKIYPTRTSLFPLFLLNEKNYITYGYNFKGNKYPLLANNIPIDVIYNILKRSRIRNDKLKLIKELLGITSNNNKLLSNRSSGNRSLSNKSSSNISFSFDKLINME